MSKNYTPERNLKDVEGQYHQYDDDGGGGGGGYEDDRGGVQNTYVKQSVITQSPGRVGGASASKGGGGGLNLNSNFQPVNSTAPGNNLMSKHNQQQKQQQQAQNQYYDPTRIEPPIYVPPYLINTNARQSRHHQFNAPHDYLPWSVANIFICVIIALPALFYSVQTRDMKRMGNVKKAKVNSKRSLVLNIVASVVGLFTIVTALILRFALYQLFVENDVRSQNVPLIAGG